MARKKRKTDRYTDKFRASAVLMLQAAGYPEKKGALQKTAKACKVPRSTLHGWYTKQSKPPPSEIRHEKKIDFLALIEKEIGLALKEMDHARQDASYKDLTTAVGILVDKKQLLSDEPTERNTTTIIIKHDDDNS